MVAGEAEAEAVAGEAAAGRAAGMAVAVANRSLVEQPVRARERDLLRPVFFNLPR